MDPMGKVRSRVITPPYITHLGAHLVVFEGRLGEANKFPTA